MVLERKIWDKKTKWKESIWKEECVLCYDEEYVIKEFNFWKLLKNKYPYAWEEKHLLLSTIRHIEHTKELNKDELLELPKIEKYLEEYYKWENYFSFIRQTNWWKSIKHIHYHYFPWVLYSNFMEEAIKKSSEKSNL